MADISSDKSNLNEAINNHIKANIQNELIKNGSDEVFKEIRNYKSDLKNELNEFNDYFKNNQGRIIDEQNFEEGYNSRTGSIESFDTLLNEYKLNIENRIEEDNFNNLSENAKNELNKQEKLNIEKFESSLAIQDNTNIENDLKKLDENIEKLGTLEPLNLKDISISINKDDEIYNLTGTNSTNEKTTLNVNLIAENEIINPEKTFNVNRENTNTIKSTTTQNDQTNTTNDNNIIDESKVKQALEDNKISPDNPYNATIESDVINKKNEENINTAKEIMDNLDLSYNESIQLYNKIDTEISEAFNRLNSDKEYQNSSGEKQSYQSESVYNNILKSNGLNSNQSLFFDKDVLKLHAIKNINNTLSNEIENYQPNKNIQAENITNDNSISENKNTDLQKLKSVELEKNVIGLLPKDQQENQFKETLSRLDKNKTSLINNLKTYMSNTKIDDVVNSVKQHFENIKVKVEDVNKTFKDLGTWNNDNKFVKNVDNIIDKVKNISQKNDNKLDINDPELLKKLEAKFKESNDYIDKVEINNSQDQRLKDNHLNYLSNNLEILNPNLLKETNEITNSLSELSKESKIELYNYSKDIESITKEKNYQSPEDIKTIIETHKLTNAIQNDLGKSTLDNSRKDYLVSNVKKPAINDNFSNNKTLEPYMKNSNEIIKNATRNDLKKYQERGNTEISKIDDNKKANTLKNNDLLQRYNKQNTNQNTSTQEESINEKKQQVKKQGVQIR